MLELLIVVIIVGILAGLAIPRFLKMTYRVRFAEVFNTVGIIARAKEIYYAEHETYEGIPPYPTSQCFAGNGTLAGNTRVQQDLGIEVDENSFFQYLVYPSSTYPAVTNIYFREPGYSWAWVYAYMTNTWYKYTSGDGGRARDYFRPPQ